MKESNSFQVWRVCLIPHLHYYQNPQDIESAADGYKTDANGVYQLIANSSE
jgi:hypothetical protein